jgi:amino acid transporter
MLWRRRKSLTLLGIKSRSSNTYPVISLTEISQLIKVVVVVVVVVIIIIIIIIISSLVSVNNNSFWASGEYKYRGLALRDGGWAWG